MIDVIRCLARQAGLNVIVSGDTAALQNRRTSLRLAEVPAEAALEQVLNANGLVWSRQNGTLLVNAAAAPMATGCDGSCEAVSLRYYEASRLAEVLRQVLPQVKASAGGSESRLVLQAEGRTLRNCLALVEQLDRPTPQVLIESQVLEISEDDALRLGVTYGSDPGTVKFVTDNDRGELHRAGDLVTSLNALLSKGKAKVVARPRIATLDGHEAVINIGSRVPYAVPVSSGSSTTQWTVDYLNAGVRLRIVPRINEQGDITALLQPEVSSISQWKSTAAGEFPVISTRNAAATLRVRDGETIVIGGLLSETERVNVSRVPIIGQVPILNIIFSNRTVEQAKTEIVFMITPHVI
ncbi:MAG: secretin and TonB N-terminal domain-containing protein [Candidatus Saganbacteria bacterium]|nr:secretin and TonB N-terminal domain-containing protein [Candidatus Saganbacteria bacterium]